MKREKLSSEKQVQYDKIYAEMREELDKLPKADGSTLCNSNNVKRREITERYLPKLQQLFE